MEELLVIGQKNCPKCHLTKKMLSAKRIDYIYKDFNRDLNEKERDFYIQLAQKSHSFNLPLLIKDDKIIKMEDLL